ncbi:MAG: restriction endonuclease subunit S [Burkholderiaceae bacterium]
MSFDLISDINSNRNKFPLVVIADVCSVGDGAHSKVSRVPHGLPYLTSKNIGQGILRLNNFDRISEVDFDRLFPKNSKSTRKAMEGDVLIGIIGTFGNAYLYMDTDNFGVASSVGILQPDQQKLFPKFLYCVITSEKFKTIHANHNADSAQGYTNNIPSIKKLRLPLPPLIQQKHIAGLLGTLDARIALLRATNATLEAIAQAMFKSWFIDFDPVHAKQEGRTPEGMDVETAALFPDSFEESELGLVPDGWNRIPFTNTVEVIGGGTPKTSIPEYWDGDIPWFSVVDAPVITDVFVIDTKKHATEQGIKNSSTKLLPEGTTIISARGTVGRLALVGRAMAMNQSCYGLRGKSGDAYFTYFSTYRLVESLKQRSHGSVFDSKRRTR